MTAGFGVFRRVTIGRIIAAKSSAALLARAEVDPARADLNALFAFRALRSFHLGDGLNVRAGDLVHGEMSRASHLLKSGGC